MRHRRRRLTLLGVMLFFQKHLIRLGNILLVAAMPLLVGPSRLMRFVLARKRAGGVFLLGFVFIPEATAIGLRRGLGFSTSSATSSPLSARCSGTSPASGRC